MSKSKVAPSEQLSMVIDPHRHLSHFGAEGRACPEGPRGRSPRSAPVAPGSAAAHNACLDQMPGGPLGEPTQQLRSVHILPSTRQQLLDLQGRGQMVGVRWEQAEAAAAVAESSGGSVRGLRDAALLAVMSDGLLRVSEAAALEAADLEGEGPNTLTIRRSKTDQEGAGAVQYIGGPTTSEGRRRHGSGRGSPRPAQHRVRSGHRPATCRRGRDRGPRVRPLATGRRGAVPDLSVTNPLFEIRLANQGGVQIRPLCPGPARRPRRGGQAPLRCVETPVGVRGRLAAEQDRLLPRSSPVRERLPGSTGRELKEA